MANITKTRLFLTLFILLIVLVAPFTPEWDLAVSSFFYYSTDKAFYTNSFIRFIYDFGAWPALFVGIGSAFLYLLSFPVRRLKQFRAYFLYLALVLAVGAGFIAHTVFKDNWGRPRPRQIAEFGGTMEFRPFYKPNFAATEPAKSFPCGHCTAGFYFFAFIFLGRRIENDLLVYLGAVLTLFLSIALSYARLAEGGHFLTDVFFSAAVMFLTAYLFDQYYLRYELDERKL